MSIWGSDVTLDERHPAGRPYAECFDVLGYYAAGDLVVTAKRTEGWLDVATSPVCDLVRLIVSHSEDDESLGVEVFLDEPQVRAVHERLGSWLAEVAARRGERAARVERAEVVGCGSGRCDPNTGCPECSDAPAGGWLRSL